MATKQQIIKQNEQHKLMIQTNSLNDTINFYTTQLILLNHSLSMLSHDSDCSTPLTLLFKKESAPRQRYESHSYFFIYNIFLYKIKF